LAEEDDLEKTFSDWVIWAYNEYFLAGVDDVNELQSAVKQLFGMSYVRPMQVRKLKR